MTLEQHSFLNFTQHIGVPTLVLSTQLDVLGANNLFCQTFQITEQAVQDLTFEDIGFQLFKEDKDKISIKQFQQDLLDTSSRKIIEATIGIRINSHQEISWFRLSVSPTWELDNKFLYLVLTFTDVTDLIGKQLTQQKISQAKNEWETTVDALQDIVTIQNKNMEIVRANKVAHVLFGYKLGELKGKKCYQAFLGSADPCPDCPVVTTGDDKCSHSETIYNSQLDRTFNVSSFPIFDEKGEMHQIIHVARDITQYLKNESEKNRLMAAIEQTSESVVISDINSNFQYVNPAFEKTSGYTREEVVGKNLNILKSGAHDEFYYKNMWETLLSKQVWRGRLTNKRKNGSLYKEDVVISPVIDTAGDIVNFVALKRDITREEQLELQLQQAMKMEALGTLAGGIAHDFNNILSAMIGYGEIALGKIDLNHPARNDLQQVLAGGDRAVDLVKQILTFSRRETHGNFSVCKIQHIVKEVVKLLRPSLPPTIKLLHTIDDSCRSIYGDPSQLYQVIMNLCTNARQAIDDAHGTIEINLQEIGINSDTNKNKGENGSYLSLEIRDTGCGMEQDHIAKIFDPFFTTKKKEQGTGLGLAVVHGIIKKHKGEIHVESEPGKGTTFNIYLSIDGRSLAGEKSSSPPPLGGSERIMIVDDEPSVVHVLAVSLKKVGYQVLTFNDSIAAVQHFRENPYCCDLVITDMLMPNMTGVELSREFLSIRKNLPIVMLTGYSENLDPEKALRLGIKEYLLKPVKSKDLRGIIRKVLEHGTHIDH